MIIKKIIKKYIFSKNIIDKMINEKREKKTNFLIYENYSMKDIFKKRLVLSNSLNKLPIITNSSLHLFRRNSNKSTVQNQFLCKDETLVRKLNLDSNETPYKLIEESPEIFNILDEKRIQYILDFNKLNGKNFKSKSEENIILERKNRKFIQKLSVVQNEEEINQKLLDLKSKIDQLKEEKENYNNEISKLLNKIDDNEIYLDAILSHNNSNTNILKEFNSGKKIANNKKNELRRASSIYLKDDLKTKKFNLISTLQRDFEENQKKKNEFENDITNNKENILQLKEKISKINEEINLLKIKYNKNKKELINHYHQLLYEGIDTRDEGLIWIIQSIWDLNEDVNMKFIPNFLDEKAIEYLFIIANKKNSLRKIDKNIEKVKLKYNYDGKNNYNENKKDENEIFHTLPLIKSKNKIKINLRNLNLGIGKYNANNSYTFKNVIKKLDDEKKIKNKNEQENLEVFLQLKKLKECILKEIEILKKKEMNRIVKEFLENDYERRFKVSFEIVLSALVGEYNMIRENEKQKNYKNEFLKKIKQSNFYRLFNNNQNQINFKKKNI